MDESNFVAGRLISYARCQALATVQLRPLALVHPNIVNDTSPLPKYLWAIKHAVCIMLSLCKKVVEDGPIIAIGGGTSPWLS